MLPAPLFASPPLTVHVTFAAPPPASVAVNCSTDAPFALVALQPVQLVSMVTVPGLIENVPFDGLAVTLPPLPQPAAASARGTSAIASPRNGVFRAPSVRAHLSPQRARRIVFPFAASVINGKCLPSAFGSAREMRLTV
jgi:hypothetical protein